MITFLRIEYIAGVGNVAVFDRGASLTWYDGSGNAMSDDGIFRLNQSNLRARIENMELEGRNASVERVALAELMRRDGGR